MLKKLCKIGLGMAAVLMLGFFLFGPWLFSYARVGVESVQKQIKNNMPLEVELQRARQMVEQIIPELRTNIQVIAREEVEVEHLRAEILQFEKKVDAQQQGVLALRKRLNQDHIVYASTSNAPDDSKTVEQLSQKFESYKQAESILASKQLILQKREQSLESARQLLQKTQERKTKLEQRIELLASEHRLLKTQVTATSIEFNDDSMGKADDLLLEIQKRLETAKRVMDHEHSLISQDAIEVPVDQRELMAEIDQHLSAQELEAEQQSVPNDFH